MLRRYHRLRSGKATSRRLLQCFVLSLVDVPLLIVARLPASVTSSIRALATSLGIKRVTSKSSHHSQDIDSDAEGSKMPSFSPGKLFGSIKARDSLAEHATPYSEIPPSDSLPETDHFKFSTPDASILDMAEEPDADESDDTGAILLPKPAPRVGMTLGAGVKSTIRLVSHPAAPKTDHDAYMSPPRLPVFKTDFDLAVGTPGTIRTFNMWPTTPRSFATDTSSLYPKLPLEDLKPRKDEADDDQPIPGGLDMPTTTPAKTPARSAAKGMGSSTSESQAVSTPGPVDQPDIFSPAKLRAAPSGVATPAASTSRATFPRSTPFLFGSPLPRRDPTTTAKTVKSVADKEDEETVGVSNAAFDGVAKSLLEEMRRRLAEQEKERGDEGKDKMSSAQPLLAGTLFGAPSATAGAGPSTTQDRFAKAHDAHFNKMDSIATHYAARRPNKRKSDALGSRPIAGQKRRSSAAGARVISAGARKRNAVPGGFGGDDDEGDESAAEEEGGDERPDEDDGARRSSKRIKITQGWDVHKGQRVSIAPPPPLPCADAEKAQKRREAAKRELEAAKARRRSSRRRSSLAVPPGKSVLLVVEDYTDVFAVCSKSQDVEVRLLGLCEIACAQCVEHGWG